MEILAYTVGALIIIYEKTRELPGVIRGRIDEFLIRITKMIIGVEETLKFDLAKVMNLIGGLLLTIDEKLFTSVKSGLDVLAREVKNVYEGGKGALVDVLLATWTTLIGVTGDFAKLTFIAWDDVYRRLDLIKDDMKPMIENKITEWLKPTEPIFLAIADYTDTVMATLNSEIQVTVTGLRDDLDVKFALVETDTTQVLALTKDEVHFAEMFGKIMET